MSNGVYYLALPNGNPFGYYSYLPDSNYIYHFDMGYEYTFDANDGHGGIYLYDFASGHWWYTGRQYPFPYIYDFSLNAFLYYFPDTTSPGHYTTNPRYFYNFATGQIITLPPVGPPSQTFTYYKLHGTATPAKATYTPSTGTLAIDGMSVTGLTLSTSIAGAECFSGTPSPAVFTACGAASASQPMAFTLCGPDAASGTTKPLYVLFDDADTTRVASTGQALDQAMEGVTGYVGIGVYTGCAVTFGHAWTWDPGSRTYYLWPDVFTAYSTSYFLGLVTGTNPLSANGAAVVYKSTTGTAPYNWAVVIMGRTGSTAATDYLQFWHG